MITEDGRDELQKLLSSEEEDQYQELRTRAFSIFDSLCASLGSRTLVERRKGMTLALCHEVSGYAIKRLSGCLQSENSERMRISSPSEPARGLLEPSAKHIVPLTVSLGNRDRNAVCFLICILRDIYIEELCLLERDLRDLAIFKALANMDSYYNQNCSFEKRNFLSLDEILFIGGGHIAETELETFVSSWSDLLYFVVRARSPLVRFVRGMENKADHFVDKDLDGILAVVRDRIAQAQESSLQKGFLLRGDSRLRSAPYAKEESVNRRLTRVYSARVVPFIRDTNKCLVTGVSFIDPCWVLCDEASFVDPGLPSLDYSQIQFLESADLAGPLNATTLERLARDMCIPRVEKLKPSVKEVQSGLQILKQTDLFLLLHHRGKKRLVFLPEQATMVDSGSLLSSFTDGGAEESFKKRRADFETRLLLDPYLILLPRAEKNIRDLSVAQDAYFRNSSTPASVFSGSPRSGNHSFSVVPALGNENKKEFLYERATSGQLLGDFLKTLSLSGKNEEEV
jgi:hypothetical protein